MKKSLRFIATLLVLSLFTTLFNTSVLAASGLTAEKNLSNHISEIEQNTIEINNEQTKQFDSESTTYNVERIIGEVLGMTVKSSEYMFNLDGSADYVYVTLEEGGYAILLKDTMELLEYSYGDAPAYADAIKKYYGGPGRYYEKANDVFVDTLSGKTVVTSKASAIQYANSVRELFNRKETPSSNNDQITLDYSSIGKTALQKEKINNAEVAKSNSNGVQNSYVYGVPISGGTYIKNYTYFLHNPMHGENTAETCGAISVQILLGYHNYYSDRRIIDNYYLNGSISEPQYNPNLCENPMSTGFEDQADISQGSMVLGSRSTGTTGNYYAKILEEIPARSGLADKNTAIINLLNERNVDLRPQDEKENEDLIYINFVSLYRMPPVLPGNQFDFSGIYNEIDNGRPVILSLLTNPEKKSSHAVVAYGYRNYTDPSTNNICEGFVAHVGYGWESRNVWMNATWCEAYTTLVIDHTHTYTEYVGKIASTGATEYKCGVCGHRTDEILGIASNDRYTEVVTELWQDNYKEYKVTFDSDGYRMLQTFGEGSEATHAYIELYGPNGLLAYDNIRGYARNPMLTYNFVADLTYTVRVSFFNSQWSFTNIKLSIIETDAYFEYEDIPSFVDRTEDYVNDFVLDKVTVFTYESTTDRDITIRLTTPHFIGYLYVIDPRSEEVLTLAVGESTKEEASLYHEADEADAGFVAEITKTLEANVPYLVILSTECPSSTMMTGEFCVTFD